MNYSLVQNAIVREDGAIIPEDPFNRDYREYLAWVQAGNVAQAAQPSLEEALAELTAVVQTHLDWRVGERNYSSILAACTYKDSANPQWAAEGAAAIAWRDAVWERYFEIAEACRAGAEAPTATELIPMLPVLTW
jgi:hypothetical protein